MNKFVRKGLVVGAWVVGLVVLTVAAGFAYTWWMGRNAPPIATQTVEAPVTSRPIIKPSTPDPNSNIGVSIQSLSTPVVPGDNALISTKSLATADCSIVVEYNKVAVKDSGLEPKKADDYGVASWSWSVAKDAPLGKWPVTVTCKFNKKTAVVRGDMEIVKTLPDEQWGS